jgi:hypothetical protein
MTIVRYVLALFVFALLVHLRFYSTFHPNGESGQCCVHLHAISCKKTDVEQKKISATQGASSTHQPSIVGLSNGRLQDDHSTSRRLGRFASTSIEARFDGARCTDRSSFLESRATTKGICTGGIRSVTLVSRSAELWTCVVSFLYAALSFRR